MSLPPILFDMDGLLFDTGPAFRLALDDAGERIGLGKAGHMLAPMAGSSIRQSRPLWEAAYGADYDEAALLSHVRDFLRRYYSSNPAPLKPGALRLLRYLRDRGYPAAVCTSAPRREALSHLEGAGIAHFFSHVVAGEDAPRSKPFPDLYLAVCRAVRHPPGECIALEDSRSGLLAAHAAGCRTVMIPDAWPGDEETARFLLARFDSLSSLIPFLQQAYPLLS